MDPSVKRSSSAGTFMVHHLHKSKSVKDKNQAGRDTFLKRASSQAKSQVGPVARVQERTAPYVTVLEPSWFSMLQVILRHLNL